MTDQTKLPSELVSEALIRVRQPEIAEHASLRIALCSVLDAEHERRAAFERDVTTRLEQLERRLRPDPQVLEDVKGKVWREPDALPQQWLAVVTKCTDGLPAVEQRVLFFVPGERWAERRWKTGHRVEDGYHDRGKVWRDDETSVGDELKLYEADQVTHWMPMPGEPA
jgi:hypothetical protein